MVINITMTGNQGFRKGAQNPPSKVKPLGFTPDFELAVCVANRSPARQRRAGTGYSGIRAA
jgi:hypothetical protein